MTSFDISDTLAPKSDQLDAVDLVSGPRTFLIESVSKGNAEQPVQIHFAEFPRPWRPGLSMRRVLVACWGKDASAYVGRSVRLYCDPDVRFGGMAVGGTRVEALSHMDKPKQVPLLIARGKSAIFVVQPLKDAPKPAAKPAQQPSNGIKPDTVTALGKAMETGLELTERDAKLAWLSQQLERPVKTPTELTEDEGARLIALITELTEPPADWKPTTEQQVLGD